MIPVNKRLHPVPEITASMPVKKKDTDRALLLLEDYCKKLKKPEEQQLKKAIKKVMGIFKSSLFQALLGIGMLYLLVFFI